MARSGQSCMTAGGSYFKKKITVAGKSEYPFNIISLFQNSDLKPGAKMYQYMTKQLKVN